MNFPAGIIQPPFFSAHYPAAWNFAALGSVMGHEVSRRRNRRDARGREESRTRALTSDLLAVFAVLSLALFS